MVTDIYALICRCKAATKQRNVGTFVHVPVMHYYSIHSTTPISEILHNATVQLDGE